MSGCLTLTLETLISVDSEASTAAHSDSSRQPEAVLQESAASRTEGNTPEIDDLTDEGNMQPSAEDYEYDELEIDELEIDEPLGKRCEDGKAFPSHQVQGRI
jgi:hypothetical protein